jgi:histidinol phosphatase-like PHP family hydrolase
MALVQSSPQKTFGYKRAAAAVLSLDAPLTQLLRADGTLAKVRDIGPASTRVILEVLATGTSPTVEQAVISSERLEEVQQRRAFRSHFLSLAEVLRILADRAISPPLTSEYRGDLQMHSTWSDGRSSVDDMAKACLARGYSYAAITDHSHGLKIARGMSMSDAARQHEGIDRINASGGQRFRVIKGIEANIGTDGPIDLSDEDAARFELVLAAPHSRLRSADNQTSRLVRAIRDPHVRILAHPRGRMWGSRAGLVADWDAVFSVAAEEGVAVEIDGDPHRQDLDYTLAARARDAGCLFALDSDAHATAELGYSHIAIAHARLAAIPRDRIVNFWELDRLIAWLSDRTH